MIISTREEPNFRDEIIGLGISQTSGGSCTGVGGYAQRVTHGYNVDSSCDDQSTAQFKVSDERSELEVLKTLLKNGYIPSFCTACYRAGRTGDRFMQFAKTGNICNYCLPNAMLTFAEYILDYGDEELNTLGFEVISKERENIANPTTKAKFDEYLQLIKEGQRDFRF
jgi:2-iminoacetate synthase